MGGNGAARKGQGGAAPPVFMGRAGMRAGATCAQRDARRLLEDALLLYGRGRFRGAIRLAVLSIEESLKGISLGIELAGQETLTREKWESLKRHGYKLRHVPGLIASGVEDGCRDGARAHGAREVWDARAGGQAIARVCTVRNALRTKWLVRNLHHVKEMCMYEEWDGGGSMRRAWNLDDGESGDVATFVLELARLHYEMLREGVAFALGTLAPTIPAPGARGRPGPDAEGRDLDKMPTGRAALHRLGDEIDARAAANGRGAGSAWR